MSSSAYRARRAALPPLPAHLAALHIQAPWTETRTGDPFLLFDQQNGNERIICFADREDFRAMCEVDTLYMDGTFSSAPRLFSQLYTIHGFLEEKQLPLAYVLLTAKTARIYSELFQMLKQHAVQMQLVLNPTSIMTDFESGLKRAVAAEFPQAQHKGCYFHFCQAVHRRVQAVGLIGLYNNANQPGLRNFVRKMMATAFLPPAEVVNAVQVLVANAPAVPRINELTDYFQDTWIAGQYPLRMWNVHQEARRTNNDCEGWHNAFNKLVGKHHPNIWEFIAALKKQQTAVAATRLQIQAGQQVAVRQLKYVRLNTRLTTITQRYLNGQPQMGVDEFLQNISHNLAAL